jgi:hypothetical protein
VTRRALRAAALVGLAWATLAGPLGATAHAAEPPAPTADERHFRAGEELAKTVTLVTGVPISPLLGVSALGAWRYFQTPETARAALPWYARPWFWVCGLALVFLFAANTTIGAAFPGLKKPMDFVEEHENKLSALLAAPIVLLEAKRLLDSAGILASLGGGAEGARLAGAGIAAIGASAAVDPWLAPLVQLGLAVLSIACFGVVFLAFHTIQVLIALSPSVILDMLLRLARLAVLGAVAAASGLHPYFGAAIGLGILVLSWLVAGWSFRLTVFGSVISWEILTGRAGTGDPAAEPLTAFAARGLAGVPPRSLGRVVEAAPGAWRFDWRPWLILPRRSAPLEGGGRLALRRGALSPTLFRSGVLREPTLARFPPRFRGREEALAQRLGAAEIQDGRIVRGARAAWAWLKELVAGAETPAESAG